METGHYRKFDILWELPALSSSPQPPGPGSSSANRLGRANFSTWCRRFVRANIAYRSAILRDIQLPLEAYAALLDLQSPQRWTDSPATQDIMDDARQSVTSGKMVQAVLEELGISNLHRPSSSGTSGTDVPRSSTFGEDTSSIAEDDTLAIRVTSSNGCNKVTNNAPAIVGTGGMDKTGHADSSTTGAPKQQPRPKRPASPDQEEMAAATEAELRELARYFPTVAKDAVFCVGCAAYSHRIQSCPLRTCRLCNGSIGDHGLFGCPALSPTDVVFRKIAPLKTIAIKKGKNSNRKGKGKKEKEMAKARELEEAAWAPEPERPAQKCKLCLEVTAHQDVCPMLWTTFVPNPFLKRKCDQISASCYLCGEEGHFGGDCSKNTGTHVSGRQFSLPDDIWCQKYAEQCIGSGVPETHTPRKQAPAKRAKTNADLSTPSTTEPPSTQKKSGGQPAAQTLSKAQIKKANRKQRLADEARGILSKQTRASKAPQANTALQTALPTRTVPPPAPPATSQKSEKQGPAQAPTIPQGGVVLKGLAGTGKSAPVPASKVYNLRQQNTNQLPLKVLEKTPAQAKQPQPPQKKKANAKQAQQSQQKPKQQQPKQQQPNKPTQPNQPGQPAKLTRKQRKRAASFTNARANTQAEQAMQAMQSIPGPGTNIPKARPGRRRRETASDEMRI